MKIVCVPKDHIKSFNFCEGKCVGEKNVPACPTHYPTFFFRLNKDEINKIQQVTKGT